MAEQRDGEAQDRVDWKRNGWPDAKIEVRSAKCVLRNEQQRETREERREKREDRRASAKCDLRNEQQREKREESRERRGSSGLEAGSMA